MTREIKNGIKQRRQINRERRNEEDELKKEFLWLKYQEKKKEVQILIRTSINEYERRVTEDIKQNGNKMWQNIQKLKGTEKRTEPVIHNEDGTKIKKE